MVASGAPEPIKPRALKVGDTVALVAPSRPGDDEKIAAITASFEKIGLNLKKAPNLTERWGYLAGSDEDRAAGVMEAWRDPEVDAIFCIVGGYGATRMIDKLDYDFIRDNPKIITGFSDITGVHLAIYEKTGLVTFHSPTTTAVYSADFESRPFATASFWNTIMPQDPAGTGKPFTPPHVYTSDGLTSPIVTIAPGVARGRLTGGNLSLIHAMMGTPFEIETKGHILFLEDVGEEPYRVDRMLSTLQLAGKLDEVEGVVLGLWYRCEAENPERSFTLDEVFQQYFAHRPYPVVNQFPVGHVRENATLPLGIMAELDANERRLTLLEDPVLPAE